MKHLVVSEYGTFLGIKSQRLIVKQNDQLIREIPLNRLQTVVVTKSGVTFSSDLLINCAQRGIKFFLTDFKGEPVNALTGIHQHGVVELRKQQFMKFPGLQGRELARVILRSKVKSQRAVLSYFAKYLKKHGGNVANLEQSRILLEEIDNHLMQTDLSGETWRYRLLGLEGAAARSYFSCWSDLSVPLKERSGRGAQDLVNATLNYGYAILQSYIWKAVINAGLEPYFGFLHTERPGKPSLVLDLMEEYRAWVVDRLTIKLTARKDHLASFGQEERRRIAQEVQRTMEGKIFYSNRRLRLETVIQRRVYQLCGSLFLQSKYRPLTFKW